MKFSTVFVSAIAMFSAVKAAPAPAPSSTGSSDQCLNVVGNGDIVDITNQINNINTLAQSLQKNQIIQLLSLESKVLTLISKVQSTTNDVKNNCPAYTDINSALALAQPLLQLPPAVNTTLTTLVNKKPVLDQAILNFVSVSWLVSADLNKLNSAVQDLETALKAIFPSDLSSIVDQVVNEINTPLTNAVNAYKNSPIIDFNFNF